MLLEAALASAGPGSRPSSASAMTCSAPLVEDVLPELRAAGVTRLFVLPLYPQYSVTTTKGSFARVDEALGRMGWTPERVNAPDAWYSEPRFLDAHAARIEEAAAKLPDPDPASTVLLYSAHSLPVSTVEKKKDPYPKHVEATCALIDERLGRRYRSRLGYQSKVGPVAWLGPSTTEVLAELAREGAKQVLVCPVAFVSDHVETLYEIRMLFADEATRARDPDLRRRGRPERPPRLHRGARRHQPEGAPPGRSPLRRIVILGGGIDRPRPRVPAEPEPGARGRRSSSSRKARSRAGPPDAARGGARPRGGPEHPPDDARRRAAHRRPRPAGRGPRRRPEGPALDRAGAARPAPIVPGPAGLFTSAISLGSQAARSCGAVRRPAPRGPRRRIGPRLLRPPLRRRRRPVRRRADRLGRLGRRPEDALGEERLPEALGGRGARRKRPPRPPEGATKAAGARFRSRTLSFRSGLATLAERLVETSQRAGVRVELNAEVDRRSRGRSTARRTAASGRSRSPTARSTRPTRSSRRSTRRASPRLLGTRLPRSALAPLGARLLAPRRRPPGLPAGAPGGRAAGLRRPDPARRGLPVPRRPLPLVALPGARPRRHRPDDVVPRRRARALSPRPDGERAPEAGRGRGAEAPPGDRPPRPRPGPEVARRPPAAPARPPRDARPPRARTSPRSTPGSERPRLVVTGSWRDGLGLGERIARAEELAATL